MTMKVILITGASSGFGKATAERLAHQGYTVYGTSRRATFSNANENNNEPYTLIPMDVCDEPSVSKAINYVLQRAGRIDVVVNNAGVAVAGAVEDCTIDDVKYQFETNFFGVWRVCRAILPTMRKQQSGYIINISSIAGLVGIPYQAAYSSAKYALEGMTESLRMEVAAYGINVVLVEPGDFATNLGKHRRKVHSIDSAYPQFETAVGIMEQEESNGPPPEKFAKRIEQIIRTSSPRLRYTVGMPSQRVVPVLRRFSTAAFVQKTLMKTYRLK